MDIRAEWHEVEKDEAAVRKFGRLFAIITAAIGLLSSAVGGAHWLGWFIAAAFFLLGAYLPMLLRPVYLVWMALAVVLGWVVTRFLLTAMFYVIMTPIGLVARLTGVRFLSLTRTDGSYWVKRESAPVRPTDAERQY